MKTSYSERDYSFGQVVLTLRTALGLTQAGLANYLGVSRRAVGEWEMGSSYPKVDRLKQLIVLGVEHQSFASGQEAEEIRALWYAAHQKVPLDERWLSTLLNQQCTHLLHPVPSPVEEARSSVPVLDHLASAPRVDWGDALTVPTFYGREEEQAQLIQWMVQERCRVVSVLGMGGIGKSALSVSIMYQISRHFEVVIFRPLRDTPSCETLLDECLQMLSPEPTRSVPASLEQRISLFLEHLRKTRALVVLDNLESLLQEGDVRGSLRPGFEGYGQLLQRVAGTVHQSCLLLTSREKPAELRPLEGKHSHSPVRSLRLAALDMAACKQLLEGKELIGSEQEQESLIEAYGGNPLALKIVGETIFDLFGGEIGPFLAEGTVIFGSITALLSEQFGRLSPLEQSVLCWLAIVREPVTLDELLALHVIPVLRFKMLEAIDAGYRRSLIERGKRSGSFTLQSVVLEYATGVLIAEGSREIQQGKLVRLIAHGLSQAHAKEYVRQTQERLLLSPLLADLESVSQREATRGGRRSRTIATVTVEQQLLTLLDGLRGQEDNAQGYGAANLIALLRLLRGHLSGLDLSQLCIRGACLQSVEMRNTSLRGALMRDSVLTEAVSANWTIAMSPDGKWWVSGGNQGQVRVWKGVRSPTLHLVWQAHTDIVWSLAFSPDGQFLATVGHDSTVKLWELESGALLWTGSEQLVPFCLAFSPDGHLLASGGIDATIRFWDAQSGKHLQMLTCSSDVWALAWSPNGSLLASGCVDGEIRLWERLEGAVPTFVPCLSMQTNWVATLAFSPNGRTLASTSWGNQTVKLWDVDSHGAGPRGQLLQTVPGYIDKSRCIAWSPDGRTLAYCNPDKGIWLWDVGAARCRAVLHGHSADVYGLAFTADGTRLLSGSADGTLRIWDIENYRCVRVTASYVVSLWKVDWSPDGRHLVSGSMDGQVTLWDVGAATPSRVLYNHPWVVEGVGWSPGGEYISSCALDGVLCLWNLASHSLAQRFEYPNVVLVSMAWSPNGTQLACGTYLRGIQVWNAKTRVIHVIGQGYLIAFWCVAWSPNGTHLAGGASDGSVYLWECAGGSEQPQDTIPLKLSGHRGRVMSLAWSPDGKRLASGSSNSSNGELFVWDVERAERVQTFEGHSGMIYGLAWCAGREGASPHGDQLISGGTDGVLRWWDVESGACVRTQEAHRGIIRAIKVSPDGKFLASCGENGAIMIWDLTSHKHLQTLQRDRPYERLNITAIRGLTEAEIDSLRTLGAIEDGASSIGEKET